MGYNKFTYTYRYDTGATTGEPAAIDKVEASATPYRKNYLYDGLNRVTTDYIHANSSPCLSRQFSYKSITVGSEMQTTTLVSGLRYAGACSDDYAYTYDARVI